MKNFTKTLVISLGVLIVLLIAGFFALNSYIYNEKQSEVLSQEQQEKLLSNYMAENISDLSPEGEVLGGTFYVTAIEFNGANSGTVAYEDGHIALVADFEYSLNEEGDVEVTLFDVRDTGETDEVSAENVSGAPTFSWRFEEAETNNLDGNPQTNVFLTATYADGTNNETLVDTVDGDCSELEGEGYEGDVSDTGRVQCYYAGLGQRYRITDGQEEYVIERKLFEEALPDTTPPNYEWEVISTISASI